MRNKFTEIWLLAQKNPLQILAISSLSALIFAYISQYFFNYQPCVLCLHQRKAFFAIIAICLFGLAFSKLKKHKKYLILICSILLFLNSALALYHSGVEHKIFAGPSTCSSQPNLDEINNLEDLAQALAKTKAIRCDEAQFIFLKLSMAEWNFIYCLALLIFSLKSLKFNGHFRSRG